MAKYKDMKMSGGSQSDMGMKMGMGMGMKNSMQLDAPQGSRYSMPAVKTGPIEATKPMMYGMMSEKMMKNR